MNEYEIREQEPGKNARSLGFTETLYVVWNVTDDRRVPFGNHQSREAAERHIGRLLDRERGQR
jgi:hypothetical protein